MQSQRSGREVTHLGVASDAAPPPSRAYVPKKISGLRLRTLPGVQTAWLGVWGLEGVVARLGGPAVRIGGGSWRGCTLCVGSRVGADEVS
jgi:hypothetical protein